MMLLIWIDRARSLASAVVMERSRAGDAVELEKAWGRLSRGGSFGGLSRGGKKKQQV